MRRTSAFRVLVASTIAVLGLGACGTDAPSTYSEQTRNDFLTSCTSPRNDELLHIKLCQCTFDGLQQAMVYRRFVEIEALLLDNPQAPLPDEVAEVVADCVVSEVEL